MKKKMLAATLLMGLLAACGGNSASIVGSWVEPVPGLEGQVQGRCFFCQYGYFGL